MSYLVGKIDRRFDAVVGDLQAAHTAWHRYLNTADRELLREASALMDGLDMTVRELEQDLWLEAEIALDEEATP